VYESILIKMISLERKETTDLCVFVAIIYPSISRINGI
jgi:hypothetical protein